MLRIPLRKIPVLILLASLVLSSAPFGEPPAAYGADGANAADAADAAVSSPHLILPKVK